jgi:hypothetical protein
MSGLHRPQGLIWSLLLPLLWAGCSRPAGLGSDSSSAQAGQHQVPFHDGDSPEGSARTAQLSAQRDGSNSETDVPFRNGQSLPAGTLLTVRLRTSISSPGASGTFEAVVDEPVVIEGSTLVPRGANVAGRVESARSSAMKRNRGFVRLTLDQMDIEGRDLPIRTSSLFTSGRADDPPVAGTGGLTVVSVEKGRRLTFRLTEAVDVVLPPAIPSR